jgi:4-hydroxybenzoate polyprenyltransferase
VIGAARGATRWAGLFVRMLRYRVAVMLWLFLLLGAARHGPLGPMAWDLLWAAVALGASYVAATTVNDVADRDIDRINHPMDRGRPLVTGEASPHELLVVHVLAATIAVAAAAPLGWAPVGIVGISLLIGHGYSLPPVRLSYRTYLAPLVLSIAYVLVPYTMGTLVAEDGWAPADHLFAGALLSLFLARITLKDFRDREGDAAYGRPTLLLRFGKDVTCRVSLAALIAGNVLLLTAVTPPVVLAISIEAFVVAIGWRLHALWTADRPHEEQLAIGLGARMGNGLLVSVLAWFVLAAEGASVAEALVVVSALATVYWVGFVAVLRDADRAVIVYKG